jgi:hypothetical protein
MLGWLECKVGWHRDELREVLIAEQGQEQVVVACQRCLRQQVLRKRALPGPIDWQGIRNRAEEQLIQLMVAGKGHLHARMSSSVGEPAGFSLFSSVTFYSPLPDADSVVAGVMYYVKRDVCSIRANLTGGSSKEVFGEFVQLSDVTQEAVLKATDAATSYLQSQSMRIPQMLGIAG